MRRVRMLCLFCVASSSLTGFGMAQYAAPANMLPTYHALHTTHSAHHAPTFAPFATADTVPPNPVLQPQPNRGRPVNAWSTAPAAVYVSPFQNSPAVNSSPGFAFQPQPVTAPQTFVHGPMGPASFPNSGSPNQSRPMSTGHSFQNVQQRNQTPSAAATPIHVYPPNIRLKN